MPHRRPASTLPALTDRLPLGDLALRVSPICIGLVGDPGVIPAAFDAGINFFFVTADMHWPLYENTRRGIEMLLARGGGVRDEIVVGVVSYVAQPEFCYLPFNETIQAVRGLERIDLSIIGGAYAPDLLVRLHEYRNHRAGEVAGVRATGATFHDRAACASAVAHGLVDVGFVRYNPVHRGAEDEVFPHVRASDGALLYNFKSTDGFLNEEALSALGLAANDWRPRVTDYYRFVFSRPEIDGVLCALGTTAHVTELADALARGPLDDEEIAYLADLADLATGRAKLDG